MPHAVGDAQRELCLHRHREFLERSAEEHQHAGEPGASLDAELAQHLQAGGAYWALAALRVLGMEPSKGSPLAAETLSRKVLALQRPNSGFAGGDGHDPHVIHTLWALQALCVSGKLGDADTDSASRFLASRQLPSGGFEGDPWGELDARHAYCCIAGLALCGRLTSDMIDKDGAGRHVESCQAPTGGFAAEPGLEPHAGHAFTCTGSLSLLGMLEKRSARRNDSLGHFLCERQAASGGLNGRPEKLPDVCYSWWVISSLCLIGRPHWIDTRALRSFILSAQDDEKGGFSDRAGNDPDAFHTFLGLASLSLLNEPGLQPVDPSLALPVSCLPIHLRTLHHPLS